MPRSMLGLSCQPGAGGSAGPLIQQLHRLRTAGTFDHFTRRQAKFALADIFLAINHFSG
jgi:hypothetical protein